MSRSWAIGDVDLHLDVDGTRVRGALERTLRDALRSGRLLPGTRLPSSRAMARDVGLARNTVAAAYARLRDAGFVEAHRGSGHVTTGQVNLPTTTMASPLPAGVISLTYAAGPAPPQVGTAFASALEFAGRMAHDVP